MSFWPGRRRRRRRWREVVEVGDFGIELVDLLLGFQVVLGLGELLQGLFVGGLKALVLVHRDAAAEAAGKAREGQKPQGDRRFAREGKSRRIRPETMDTLPLGATANGARARNGHYRPRRGGRVRFCTSGGGCQLVALGIFHFWFLIFDLEREARTGFWGGSDR